MEEGLRDFAGSPAANPYPAVKPDPYTPVPNNQWQSYIGCQADAFNTAAKTLLARRKQYSDSAAIFGWLHGQDAVFSNCTGLDKLPSTLPNGAPVWLQKDRAYQVAAAQFYRNDWPNAIAGFTSIAADKSSPWHDLAGYLIGRALIRQSSLNDEVTDNHFDRDALEKAEKQMQHVVDEHGAYAASALDALNYIDLHLHPGVVIARIGQQVSRPDSRLAQHLYNLHLIFYNHPRPVEMPDARKSDLIDWIVTMHGGEQGSSIKPSYALNRWRTTHRDVWLVAALATHTAKDGPLPDDVLAAAAAVPENSPAWPSVAWYRVSNLPPDPAVFAEIARDYDTLVAVHALPSTVNAFATLAIQQAPTVQDFARLAPMEPAGSDRYGAFMQPLRAPGKDPDYRDDVFGKEPVVTMAGLPVNVAGVKRFDETTATLLNDHLPLSVLVPLVVDSNWPKQIRFEAAMAVWTRAVLLDQPEQAAKLTPILSDGEPAWAPFLTAYGASTTADERRITGLLALLRFPAVRPFIQPGPGREEGMAGYSVYRDNWWCPKLDRQLTTIYGDQSKPRIVDPLPPFITPGMSAGANREQAQLTKIGGAATWFGKQTIAAVKANPNDPRNAALLGFAFRAMRNGCDVEEAYLLKRQVYNTLETRYPQSEWAKRWPDINYTRSDYY